MRFRRLTGALIGLALSAGLGLVGATPAQAVVTNDTTVQAWYQTFLGRTAAAAAADQGRFYWVGLLDRGWRPSDVLWAILHSSEYNGREIAAYYNSYLLHAPDAGASYWVNSTTYNGMALEWVAQNVLASNEYWQHFNYSFEGGAGQGVVAEWYIDILGRYSSQTSSGEISFWTGRVRQVGTLQAVREIWYSDEAVRRRINDTYNHLLFHDADYGGLGYWYPKEVESDINVNTLIGSTPEYISRNVF